MTQKDIVNELTELAAEVEREALVRALYDNGAGRSTAEQLVDGRYTRTPGRLLAKAIRETIDQFRKSKAAV